MKELNFKKWLKRQGVDVDLFWERCKEENQKWELSFLFEPRHMLKTYEPKYWVSNAFYRNDDEDEYWEDLDLLWNNAIDVAREEKQKIVFGF